MVISEHKQVMVAVKVVGEVCSCGAFKDEHEDLHHGDWRESQAGRCPTTSCRRFTWAAFRFLSRKLRRD